MPICQLNRTKVLLTVFNNRRNNQYLGDLLNLVKQFFFFLLELRLRECTRFFQLI